MKKTLTYFGIVVAIMYTALWFFVANKIENGVYKALDQLKTGGNIKKYSAPISVWGYPFSFNIKFESPSVSLNPGRQGSSINSRFDGTIEVKTGLFSRYLSVTTQGDMYFKGNIDDYHFDIVSEGDRKSTYQVKLSGLPISPFFISKVISVSKSKQPNYIELFSGFRVDSRAFMTHDKLNNTNLIESTKINLGIDGDFTPGQIEISGKEFIDRTKFFPESKRMWHYLRQLPAIQAVLQSLGKDVTNYFDVFALTELGSMNYDIDFKYKQNKLDHQINLHKFNIRDDLYAVDVKGDFDLNSKKVDADFKGSVLCSDKWYPLMQQYVNTFKKKGIFSDSFAGDSILGTILSPITGFFNALMQNDGNGKYVPRLNLMGPIKIEADVAYQAGKDKNFTIDTKNFHIDTRAYFIDVKGNFKHVGKQDIYNIKAILGNYNSIVDYSVDYVNRVSSSSNYVFKALGGNQTISNNITEKIKKFLRNVSDNPDSHSKDIKLTIINKGNGVYPAVGRYSSEEFRSAWNNFVASIIIDKVTGKIDNVLKQGGNTIKKGLKGDIAGSIESVAKGVFGLVS